MQFPPINFVHRSCHYFRTLVFALALPGLAFSQTVPTTTAAKASAAAPVTLHELVLGALQANLEIQTKRLDTPIQDSRVLAAWGAFDPVLSLSALRE